MGRQEQPTEVVPVGRLDRGHGLGDAGDLGDHVAGPAGQARRRRARPTSGSVAARSDRQPEQAGRLLAVAAARRVAAVVERVRDAGVHHQHLGGGRAEEHRTARPRGEVDEQRGPGLRRASRRSGPCRPSAHRRSRSPPACTRRPARRAASGVTSLPDEGRHRHRHRALDRRRARQPGAERDGAVDEQVGSRDVDAALAQRPGHPGGVRRPAGHRARRHVVEAALPRVRLLAAGDPQPTVGSRGARPRRCGGGAPPAGTARRCSRCARRSGSPGPGACPTTAAGPA